MTTATTRPTPTPADLDAIAALCRRGRFLEAFARTASLAPFEAWRDPAAVARAASLCDELGGARRAQALALGLVRRAPRSPIGRTIHVALVARARGPLAALLALERGGDLDAFATGRDRARFELLRAQIMTALRDFERAELALDAAERLDDADRVTLARARLRMAEDRYAEALALAERAAAAQPGDADAIGFAAHLLLLTGEPDAALARLREGAAATESAELALFLAHRLEARGAYDEQAAWIERWVERTPLREEGDERAAQLRADCAYLRGDVPGALRLLAGVRAPFHARVAARLASPERQGRGRRVLIDVPFVRQHHVTCAPATLSAIAAHWGVAAPHLEVAEAICYDGTAPHRQRQWAEENGFLARELSVTWDAARELLDRGVPFTVGTVQAANAHLQALVGYDERRGTLFIRDPYVHEVIEALAEEWLDEWRATGPYGMALVPVAERARLEGATLPDAALYDRLHALHVALEAHDRDAAVAEERRIAEAAPGHRLALAARRALAGYDGDATRTLACARECAAAYPRFVPAKLEEIACMRVLAPRGERIAALEALVTGDANPFYGEALARELVDDAREHDRAARLLRRSARGRPDRAEPLGLLATIAAARGDRERALLLRRTAACLARFDEGAAVAYFVAARVAGREGEALGLLERRAEELGRLSAQPLATLFAVQDAVGRADAALALIDAAVAERPDDGALLLVAASTRASLGDDARAAELLARAKGKAHEADWLRTAAAAALHAGRFDERRALLERLLAAAPLDDAAHVAYANALAASRGAEAARAHLEEAWSRAPQRMALARAWLAWIEPRGAEAVCAATERVLASDQSAAWARIARATALGVIGRKDDALAEVRAAKELAPGDASLEVARAKLLTGDEAAAALREAIRLDADRDDAIELLARQGAKARGEALAFIEEQVIARSVTGAGLEAWYVAARASVPPATLLPAVDRVAAARPGLAAAIVCAIRQRTATGEHAEATALARRATERFPTSGGVWLVLAEALAAAGDHDAALAALEDAVRIDDHHDVAAARLSAAYVARGDRARAAAALRRAIGRRPDSEGLRLALVSVELGRGEEEAALAALRAAIELAPESADVWNVANGLAADAPEGSALARAVEELAAARPFAAHASVTRAKAHARRGDLAGAQRALDDALRADARLVDAHDFRAVLHAAEGDYARAEAACAPAAFAGEVPRELRGRAAWLRARRGDLAGACAAMAALVEELPEYPWAWAQLVTWSARLGAPADAVRAARRLVDVTPRASGAHHVLAEALLGSGERADAREALRRALDLDPENAHAAMLAFDLALEDDDGDEAARALRSMERSPTALLAARARFDAYRGREEAAVAALRALALHPAATELDALRARRALIDAGLAARCHALFDELLHDAAAPPFVGMIWARTLVARGDVGALRVACRRLDPTPAVRGATLSWVDAACAAGDGAAAVEAVRLLQTRFGRLDDPTWAGVGQTLLRLGDLRGCVEWMRGYRDRNRVTPAMLLPYASAARELGYDEEARDVIAHAATLAPTDGASASHRTWLAFERAHAGDPDGARGWLTAAAAPADNEVLAVVATLTWAMLAVLEAPRSARRSAFARARELLAGARARVRNRTVLVRAHERASRRIAAMVGPLGPLWLHRETIVIAAAAVGLVFGVLVSIAVKGNVTMLGPSSIGVVFALRYLAARKRSTS